jgi:hypothetical protein
MASKYKADEKTMEDLSKRFSYHSPKTDQPPRYEQIRQKAHNLAIYLVMNTPKSREQSTALTKLDEVVMFANASIARNESEDEGQEKVVGEVMVNGSSIEVMRHVISYEMVVQMAGFKETQILSVIAKFPDGAQSMFPGVSVTYRPNMVFSVADTSNA